MTFDSRVGLFAALANVLVRTWGGLAFVPIVEIVAELGWKCGFGF
jgi:hypothetical protein